MAEPCVLDNVLDAIRTRLVALNLAGIDDDNIRRLERYTDRETITDRDGTIRADTISLPGIIIVPIAGERYLTSDTSNVRDLVEYPIGIAIVANALGSSQSSTNTDLEYTDDQVDALRRQRLHWRQRCRRVLIHNRTELDAGEGVCIQQVVWVSGEIANLQKLLQRGIWFSSFVVGVQAKECRTYAEDDKTTAPDVVTEEGSVGLMGSNALLIGDDTVGLLT